MIHTDPARGPRVKIRGARSNPSNRRFSLVVVVRFTTILLSSLLFSECFLVVYLGYVYHVYNDHDWTMTPGGSASSDRSIDQSINQSYQS